MKRLTGFKKKVGANKKNAKKNGYFQNIQEENISKSYSVHP